MSDKKPQCVLDATKEVMDILINHCKANKILIDKDTFNDIEKDLLKCGLSTQNSRTAEWERIMGKPKNSWEF